MYGNDDTATSTQVTQGLLDQYPNLKGIISPTTVGIAAAAAVELASGTITTAAAGQTFSAGKLGSFTVGVDSTVLLGAPYVFNASNINNFNF